MIEAFLSTFFLVLITELGDKSMLSAMIFSATYRKPIIVFIATILALITVTLIGLAIGFLIIELVPITILHYISGALFIVIGVYYLLTYKNADSVYNYNSKFSFVSVYSFIFISEFGDKTQIAIISLVISTLSPIGVFSGAVVGFIIVNGLAVFIGDKISGKLPLTWIKLASAIIFILFGILTIFGVF
ncbi:MAG: TMEM165/GDT1 family protein [Candidatus Odinarchaeia archaeon]